jgi:hypothetical protein
MSVLEQRLSDLGRALEWPETPRLEVDLERRPAGRPWLRPLALGLALALATLGAVLALSPGARSAFLEIFRLQGASVELVETLPEVQAQRLDFGEQVSREEAERRVGFQLLELPGADPDAVYVRSDRAATLVYGDPERPRLVLTQLRGAVYEGFVKKVGGSGTRVEEVSVAGERGLFVSGDDHFVMWLDENFDVADEPTYLAGTVLLWNRGELLLRLEGELTKAEALELAESVE